MRLWSRIKLAARALLSDPYAWPRRLEPGFTSSAGEFVSESAAVACAAVWACVRVIADAVASLPLHLYRRLPNDARERAIDHPLYAVLHDAPAPNMTSLRFRHLMQVWVLLWGNAYALKQPNGTSVVLHPIHPSRIAVKRDQRTGALSYVVEGKEELPERAVFHLRGLSLDGVIGQSVISAAHNTIGLSLVQERYAAEFFRYGGRRPYVIKKASRFASEAEFEGFKSRLQEAYASSASFHRAMVLEGDLDIKELGMSLQDAQLLASRQFSVTEICRWFCVPPHLVGDLSRATYANIEHQSLEFVQFTLRYWLETWEQEISAQLLSPEERRVYYAEHDINGLLRGDFASRTRGYATLIQTGVMSINEARRLENMPAVEGGDRHWVPLNLQPI